MTDSSLFIQYFSDKRRDETFVSVAVSLTIQLGRCTLYTECR